MKYFTNGVRVSGASPDTIASAAVETGVLRPSLFSLRCHHDSLHKSLKSLLHPDRVSMRRWISYKAKLTCGSRHVKAIAYIDAGVIVDALDRRYGRTPLQYAAGNNNTAIMRLLLQAGANVHSAGIETITPILHFILQLVTAKPKRHATYWVTNLIAWGLMRMDSRHWT
jgi:hypothetical protein